MKIQRIILLLSCINISGCTYSSQFDCPVGEGNRCASLTENVKKIDEGFYDEKSETPVSKKIYFRGDF